MGRQTITITFDCDELAEGGPNLGQEMAGYLRNELIEAYGEDGQYLMGYDGPFVSNVEATHTYLKDEANG